MYIYITIHDHGYHNITPKRKTVRVCFSENLHRVNLLFHYEKLKYDQVSQACRKHYILISSNPGIKKILTKH